jgi:hypothetical protein
VFPATLRIPPLENASQIAGAESEQRLGETQTLKQICTLS